MRRPRDGREHAARAAPVRSSSTRVLRLAPQRPARAACPGPRLQTAAAAGEACLRRAYACAAAPAAAPARRAFNFIFVGCRHHHHHLAVLLARRPPPACHPTHLPLIPGRWLGPAPVPAHALTRHTTTLRTAHSARRRKWRAALPLAQLPQCSRAPTTLKPLSFPLLSPMSAMCAAAGEVRAALLAASQDPVRSTLRTDKRAAAPQHAARPHTAPSAPSPRCSPHHRTNLRHPAYRRLRRPQGPCGSSAMALCGPASVCPVRTACCDTCRRLLREPRRRALKPVQPFATAAPAPAHPRGCCSPVRHRSSQSGISLHPHLLSLIPGLSRSPSIPARNGASSVPRTLPCMSSRLCWPCSPERLQQRTLPRPSPPSRPGKSFSRRLTRLLARLPTPAVCRQALPLHSTTTALNDLTNLLRPSLPPAPSARSPSPLLHRHRPSCGWPSRGCS